LISNTPYVEHITNSHVFYMWDNSWEHQYFTTMETIGSDDLLPDIQLDKEVSRLSVKNLHKIPYRAGLELV